MAGVFAAASLAVGYGYGSVAGAAPRTSGATPSATSVAASFYRSPVPLPPAPPGAVIRASVIPSHGRLPKGSRAFRVLYHSQSIAGADVAVSGVVVVPAGSPPPGGFPIVAWAHGTTGLASQCAPSLGGFGSIPSLDAYLSRGMIVAATDYEGLGAAGIHPYLVGASEAQGVLDSARAARDLLGTAASNQVSIVGFSQGGQAALFASQIAPSYAPELFVAGAVAAAPVTSLAEFVPSRPSTRSDPDAVYAVMALDSWSKVYGNLPLSGVLVGTAGRQVTDLAAQCTGAVAATYDSTGASRLFRPNWETGAGVRVDAALNRPGQAPTSVPLLVVEGTKDGVTPYRTVTDFVSGDLCRGQHDTVQYTTYSGIQHADLMTAAQGQILRWISQRLTGAAPGGTCRSQ
jgi:pimeloyl-ACP methyl ester carboxylesterase